MDSFKKFNKTELLSKDVFHSLLTMMNSFLMNSYKHAKKIGKVLTQKYGGIS